MKRMSTAVIVVDYKLDHVVFVQDERVGVVAINSGVLVSD